MRSRVKCERRETQIIVFGVMKLQIGPKQNSQIRRIRELILNC